RPASRPAGPDLSPGPGPGSDAPAPGGRAGAWPRRLAAAWEGWVAALTEALGGRAEARAARRLRGVARGVGRGPRRGVGGAAWVGLAGELGGPCRVELLLDRDDGRPDPDPRRLALWPGSAGAMTDAEVEALGYPLCLGLWCGTTTG